MVLVHQVIIQYLRKYRTIGQDFSIFLIQNKEGKRKFTVLFSLGSAIVNLDLVPDLILHLNLAFKKVPGRVRGYKYNKP
jgi:hypothetical protein